MNWQASCELEAIQARAMLNQKIRAFFYARQVLEVETPLIGEPVTDVFIESFSVYFPSFSEPSRLHGFLQSSPEYYLKRLLASGAGDIYQLGKVFRAEESGRFHSGEFTMLEWYRVGWSLAQLIDEVLALLDSVGLVTQEAQHFRYNELFKQFAQLDLSTSSLSALQARCQPWLANDAGALDRDSCLDLIMTHEIEPKLSDIPIAVVTDFPASQAALAKIDPERQTACRFEVYVNGVELANGYDELQDAQQLRARFEQNLKKREQTQKVALPMPEALLAALPHMPACVGVALGVDRLLMALTQKAHIQDVLSFSH